MEFVFVDMSDCVRACLCSYVRFTVDNRLFCIWQETARLIKISGHYCGAWPVRYVACLTWNLIQSEKFEKLGFKICLGAGIQRRVE